MAEQRPAPGDTAGRRRRSWLAWAIPVALVVVIAVIVIVVLSFTHGAVSPPAPISGTPSVTQGGGTPGQDR
jgi:hypothetical protein